MRVLFDITVFTTASVLPFSVHASFFGSLISTSVEAADATTTESYQSDSIIDTRVLVSAQNPNPNSIEVGSEIVIDEDALISSGPVSKDKTLKHSNSDTISVYIVREGDSLSQIAEMFGVTANTILWANDITKASAIKPGDSLIILPIVGTRHVVKSGDTLASIAKKYDGNVAEIISYNQLSSETNISVGDTIMVPGGEMTEVAPKVATKVTTSVTKLKVSTPANTLSGLINPVPGSIKTQGIHGHNGVDFGAHVGTPVRAAAGGTIIIAKGDGGWGGGYGNYVVIKHANGVQTLYAHLSQVNVSVGETVASGENIGKSGNTGKSTGPHLHFEVRGAKNPF